MVKFGNLNELPKFALREYRPPYGTCYINFSSKQEGPCGSMS